MRKYGQILICDPDDGPVLRRVRSVGAFVIALVIFSGWFYTLQTPRVVVGCGGPCAEKLREEFEKISAPKGASPIDSISATSKSSSALVTRNFSVEPFSFDVVLKHYDEELKRNGWSNSSPYASSLGGQDHYCKGAYRARVSFTQNGPVGDSRYSFSMIWGDVSPPGCHKI